MSATPTAEGTWVTPCPDPDAHDDRSPAVRVYEHPARAIPPLACCGVEYPGSHADNCRFKAQEAAPYKAGRDGLDVERLARAMLTTRNVYSTHTGSSHKAREKAYLKAAADLAAEYAALATPSDTPKERTP